MIDLIVPTIFAHIDFFTHYLPVYINNPYINSIIVIDNSNAHHQNHFNSLSRKIIYLPQKKNIFVNPSWNLGVKYSQSEFIILLNDDVFISDEAFLQLLNFGLKSKSIVCARINSYSNNKNQRLHLSIEKKYYDSRYPVNISMGSIGHMLMMKRTSYVPIPSELKIFFGDDFLISKMNNVYIASGGSIKGSTSKSILLMRAYEQYKATLQDDWIYAATYLLQGHNRDNVYIFTGSGSTDDLNILLFMKSKSGVKYCAIGVRIYQEDFELLENGIRAYAEKRFIIEEPSNGILLFNYQYFANPANSNEDAIVKMLGCEKSWIMHGVDRRDLFRDVTC